MSDTIYFVEPTRDSIDLILADFPKQDNIEYDQYGQVHLVFTRNCPESLAEHMAMNQKLA